MARKATYEELEQRVKDLEKEIKKREHATIRKDTALHRKAEEFINKYPSAVKKIPPKDIQFLVEDLQIHKTELEMKNEELQRTQLKLIDARDKYSDLYDNAPVGYFSIDNEGKILNVNIRGAAMLGMEQRSLTDRSFSDFIARDDQDIFYLHRQELSETKSKQTYELRLVKKTGSQFFARVESIARFDKENALSQIRMTINDINDHKVAEKARQTSEKKYRLLAENATDVIWTTDTNLNFTYFSPSVGRLRGYTPEEAVAQSAKESMTSESFDVAMDIFMEEVALLQQGNYPTGKTITHDFELTCKDGSTVWAEVSMRFLFENDSDFIGVLGISRDNTERKQAEEKLRKAHAEVEAKVEERTTKLSVANENLAAKIAELKQAEKSLRESEEHHRSFMENAKGFVVYRFEVDPENYFGGRLVFVSPGIEDEIGVSPEAEFGEWFNNVHPDDLPGLLEANAMSIRNGDKFDQEFRWKNLMGEWGWCRTISNPVFDSEGNPKYFNGMIINVTETYRSEKALRESEEKFRTLVETTSDWIWEVDTNGIYTYISPQIEALSGYTPEEMIGKTPFDLMPPDEAKRVAEIFRIIVEERKPIFNLENTNLHKDGRKVVFETSGTPILDDKGGFTGYRGIDRDITSRKLAEEALRESEEKHKRIVDNALTGIYQVEKEGGFIMANQRIAEMFGYDSPESLMSSVDSIASLYVHPEERAMILQEIDEKGSVYGKEAMFKRKTGGHFWVKYHVRVLREKGKTIYEGLMEDVTAEKSSQEAQRASELRYRSLFENASMGISLTTSDGQMLDANNSILQMMSGSRSDIEQLNVTDFYKNFQDRESLLKRLERDGSVHGFETILKRKDGTLFDARLNVTKLNIDNRDLLLTIIEDFTKEKTLTENLERAQRMEAIGTLAGGVAHDLNNILGGLVSYPELLLLKLPEDSPLRDMVSTIQKSGERAAATVQDLLTLARRGLLVTELINLNDIVSEYLQSPEHNKLQTYHPEIHLETCLERYPLHIEGSPIHLSKTVMNLISNAAEAMPEGGKLTVSLENKYIDRPVSGYDNMDEGDYMVLTVSDTGTGISPNDMGVALLHFRYNDCCGCYSVHSSGVSLLDYFKMAGVLSI